METKECSACGKEKPINDFPKGRDKCKECIALEAKDRAKKQKQIEEEYKERMSILDDYSSEELLETLYNRGYKGDLSIDSNSLQRNELVNRYGRRKSRIR